MPTSFFLRYSSLATLLLMAVPTVADTIVNVDPKSAVKNPRQPQATVSSDGTIYVVFGADETIYCCRSTDGGESFQSPTRIGSLPGLALGRRRGPRIAAGPKGAVVTAISHKTGNLFAWYSNDEGRSWNGPQRVNDSPKDCREGLHAMAVAPDGGVFCTWLDLRSGSTEIFGSYSTDGGSSWGDNQRVYRSPSGTVCECCHPAATYDSNGRLHVMWRNSLKGARDMFLASSEDNGQTFSAANKLGQGVWTLNACPMDGGYLAAYGDGKLTTVWRRRDVIYRTDSPGTTESRVGTGLQPWVTGTRKGVTIVWLSRQNGPLMYLAPGLTEPRPIADSATDPVVVSPVNGQSPVLVVWESGSGDRTSIKAFVGRP